MTVLPRDPLFEGAAVELVVVDCAKAGDIPAAVSMIPVAIAIL
ncbi:MAG TPA: hypothetical protein VL752_00970 [Acidisoma sp.]|nr:hypothetical protein [Acidisoma sp.]HTH99488.1 hypothetical protein [Acidisoma sp.]